jgi:hypothetical protein
LATTVRQQVVILNASSTPAKIVRTNAGVTSVDFQLSSSGNTLLPMPAGTTVTAAAVDNTQGNLLSCTVGTILNPVVPNVSPSRDLATSQATSHVVGLTGCAATDTIEVKVTAPSGLVYSQTFVL